MADNTFVNIGGHKVSAGKVYSTSEVKTGDVWIDGKPIYRRVFTGNLDTITTATYNNTYILWSNSSIDKLLKIGGYQLYNDHNGNSGECPIPYVFGSISGTSISITQEFAINMSNGDLNYFARLGSGANIYFSGQAYSIVIEYTKTTD